MDVTEKIFSLLKSSTENLIFDSANCEYFLAICKKSDVKELIKDLSIYLEEPTKEIFEKTIESVFVVSKVLNPKKNE